MENLKEVQPGAPMRDGAEREWHKNGWSSVLAALSTFEQPLSVFEQPYQGLNSLYQGLSSLIRVKRICARAALKCLEYQIG